VDLQFGQQQVDDRDRGRGELQPVPQVDRMRHYELVEEHVGLITSAGVVIDKPLDPELLAVQDPGVEEISPVLKDALDSFLVAGVGD